MSTPYSVFDNKFLNKITDDLLLTMADEHLEKTIDMYRDSASVRFKQCNKFSSRNNDIRQYDSTFTDEEIEIVSSLMVLEWLRQRINSIELLKQSMSTKDYRIYSQANHLETLIKLRKDTLADVDRLIVSYTYSQNNLSDLGKA